MAPPTPRPPPAARPRSFATALIGPPDAPLGAISIAREDRAGLDDKEWWSLWLTAAATGLLQSLHHWQVGFTCRMLRRIDALADPVTVISCVLQVRRGAGLCANSATVPAWMDARSKRNACACDSHR